MNLTINLENGLFQLLDDNQKIVFQHVDWKDIEEYGYANNVNIKYGPKDLVFDISFDQEPYIFLDVKYSEGHDDLGYHNVYGLPNCIDPIELTECTFSILENFSKEEVIESMTKLGAKREFFL